MTSDYGAFFGRAQCYVDGAWSTPSGDPATVVIDPFSEQCVVVTGSHNLGHKASFDNDENLVIVEGNKSLAVAYATHVLDVYDHFSWRWNVKREGHKAANQKLSTTPKAWLDRYFDAKGDVKVAQLRFWMSAAV